MLLGARQFFERRGAPVPHLPYDAEVQYLQSTGTQYIDTGVFPRYLMTFKCAFRQLGTEYVYGLGTSVFNVVGFGKVSSGFFQWAPNRSIITSSFPFDDKWHVSEMGLVSGANWLEIDGAVAGSNTAANVLSPNATLPIFARRAYSGSMSPGASMISGFSITDTSTNIQLIDFASVRFTNELGQSEGAMYDRVSGALFRNAGTGAFVVGPDKS